MADFLGLTPDVYISPSGNDTTGDGTYGNPYLTTTKAHAVTSDGDIIGLLDGSYVSDGGLGDDFDSTRTYVGESSTGCNIIGDASSSNAWSQFLVGANGSTTYVKNMTFKDGYKDSQYSNFIKIRGSSYFNNVVFDNLTATGSLNGAVAIIGSTYAGNETYWAQFTSCKFTNINEFILGGSYLSNSPTTEKTIRLINCIIDGSSDDVVIFSANGATSDYFHVYSRNTIFYNSSTSTTIQWTTVAWTSNIDNDVDYDCRYNTSYLERFPTAGAHTITSDPKFIDAASDDFRLRPSSPCINSGTTDI